MKSLRCDSGSMQNISVRAAAVLVASWMLPGVVWSSALEGRGADGGSASDYVEFVEEVDGKCHNLSEGGKLRQIRNRHPTKRLKVRLSRLFSEVRQAGAVDVELSGGEMQPLGCSLVDGHVQRWLVNRVQFRN